MTLITCVKQVDFYAHDLPSMPEPRKVLLCTPEHFSIIDIKNAYMKEHVGASDVDLATQQWSTLRNIYLNLKSNGFVDEVTVMHGAAGCEDMVFCANQSFPWIDEEGNKKVVMSNMRHESRKREVPYFEELFDKKLHYDPLHLNGGQYFEGMGDAIPHVGKRLLYGGYGHRSELDAYRQLAEMLNVKVVALELVSESFYHLDTCFLPLDEDSVMLCRDAFSDESYLLIEKIFKFIYLIPREEALRTFCLNAHILSDTTGRKTAVMQPGSIVALDVLLKNNFAVIETDTSEFIKSGGSVFCLKMMYY